MTTVNFSTGLALAIKPLTDIKDANKQKKYYEAMEYNFEDNDKLSFSYSTNGENATYEEALDFAKEQIINIEDNIKTDKYDAPYSHDEKLNLAEIMSANEDEFSTYDGKDLLEQLDLDGDTKSFSAQEYASYIYTLDKLHGVNGSIDVKDLESAENFQQDLKKLAQEIYDENNKNTKSEKSLLERLGDVLTHISLS